VNIVLAVFNLLPAFPMDGGRVLRALLAFRLSRATATRIAAATGMFFAGLFVLIGLLSANLILALIGFFIWSGAHAERMAVEREETWSGLLVRDVMNPARTLVEAWRSAADAAEILASARATALPVVESGRITGVIADHHLTALDGAERWRTPVRAVMDGDAPHLQAGESLIGALEQMAERQVSEAPVMDGQEVVGVLEPNDLGRLVKLRQLAREGRGVLVRPWPRPLDPAQPPGLHRDQ
jgi:predicted transcriptional regulator